MKSILVFVFAFLFTVFAVTPISAQEVTPEPTPVETELPPVVNPPVTVSSDQIFVTAMVALSAVVVVAFGVFGAIVRPVLVSAVNQMPSWGVDMLLGAGNAGVAALEDRAEETVDPADDTEVAKLRKAFDELAAEIRAARTANG